MVARSSWPKVVSWKAFKFGCHLTKVAGQGPADLNETRGCMILDYIKFLFNCLMDEVKFDREGFD